MNASPEPEIIGSVKTVRDSIAKMAGEAGKTRAVGYKEAAK